MQFLHVQWAIDQQPEAQRPNVLLFLLDDQGIARTPNGDKLAPSGIWFSDLYAGNPNSSLPSAALLTGLTAAGTTSVDIEQLPALPTGHRGYKLVKSAEVPLEFPPVVDGDEVKPALSTATVNGDILRLTYEEALDGSSTPLADDFRVVVSGERKSVSAVMVGGSTVRLRLASAVAPGEAVTLSYTVGVGARAKPIRDEAGNEAAGFTNRAVVNRTGDKRVRTGKALPVKAVRQIEALLAAKEKRTPARRKVGSQLLDALRRVRGQPAADRLVTVDIRADVTPAVLARIRSLGGTVVNSVPKYRAIRARLPLVSVEKLAALDAVQSIRTADKAVIRDRTRKHPPDPLIDVLEAASPRAVNTTLGDVAHQANLARQTHGVDGAGIGVLSNGVDSLAERQAWASSANGPRSQTAPRMRSTPWVYGRGAWQRDGVCL